MKSTNEEFYVFNIHLDHESKLAQEKGTMVIDQYLQAITEPEASVFVLGDYNTYRKDRPYQHFTVNRGFQDAWLNAASTQGKVSYTYHAWLGVNNPKEIGAKVGENHIDFVLYSPPSIVVMETQVITEQRGQNLYPSDHFPVQARVRLPPPLIK